ncbi:MAG: 3-deoxy-7-phosphoheptulonate synthase [Planctomycetota bacterium]
MIIVMKSRATDEEIARVIRRVEAAGLSVHLSRGVERTIIGVKGASHEVRSDAFSMLPGVEDVVRILKPYKLASREFHPENTVVEAGGVAIGGISLVVEAGPCSVESEAVFREIATLAKEAGARILRGGAFKPRTSPYSFQGLGEEGLRILRSVGDELGLPIQTEAMNVRTVELVVRYADIIQVGARNMQNYDLLKEVGQSGKPVVLKRGMAATVQDLLLSAEYILHEGNDRVILCERGIRTFETATRNTLDISAVPVIKALSHLPVFVDPSHASGHAAYVAPLALAAVAAGCDGLMVEMHTHPEEAKSDGEQSLVPEDFARLVQQVRTVAQAVGRIV